MTQADARSHALKIGLATVAAKIIALEALTVTGPLAYPLKAAIAGPIIKIIGDMVIEYYDGGGGAVAYSDNRSRVGYYE